MPKNSIFGMLKSYLYGQFLFSWANLHFHGQIDIFPWAKSYLDGQIYIFMGKFQFNSIRYIFMGKFLTDNRIPSTGDIISIKT